MKSLRTRQPSDQARQQDAPQNSSEGKARPRPNARPANPQARKSRVDDKIKRRMSMRYGDADASGYPVPDVPSLPGASNTRGSGRDVVREDPRAVDIDILQQDNFDPDAYLRLKLNNSTEAELKTLQSSLIASKSATATDLQFSIFKNYEEFILISKEISTLENDLLELKQSLSEWKSMPSLLRIEDSGSQGQDRRRAQRSSVADLRVLYASQMQELHTKIEGSSKLVPAIPGRHVITQTPELYHLNPATYKVEYAVVLVLLDDSLLVAKCRRRRNGERGRLVAERAWNLGEVVIVDVKDTPDRTNIIKLRHGREGHVFRTERSGEKKSLLSSFRQASENLATKRRKEREGEHERRMSVWTMGDRLSMADFSAVPPLPEWAADAGKRPDLPSGMKEKAENDARWINEFADSLTVAIALHEWEDAVVLVEQGQKQLATKPALKHRLTQLTSSLTSALLHSLSDHRQRKTSVVRLSSYLARLQATPAARAAFLAARGELIKKRIRMIPLEGDIPLYIFDLAIIVFTAIKHTAEWYLAAFKENDSISYFVQWSKEQVEHYCTMFRKQLDSTDDEGVLADCNEITRVQSKRLLQDNGLDFNFLLTELQKPLSSLKSPNYASTQVVRPEPPRSPMPDSVPSNRRPVPPRSQNRPPSIVSSSSYR